MRRRTELGRALAPLACLLLAGCAAALELASRQPPDLYALTPKSTFEDDLPEVPGRLTIEVPTATAGLNTARIALKPTPTTVQYYAAASWIDVLPLMVQNLLLESFDNAGTIDVLGRDVPVRADYALLTHIREFQAEYERPGAAPVVHVRLQARLIRLPRRTSVAATSAEASVPAEATSVAAIVRAFDEAFGKATKRIVEWTIQELANPDLPPI
jgi:cholesterol transport system auxiliary component